VLWSKELPINSNDDGRKEQPISERERALQRALARSVTALDDWINTYASEFCDADRVAAAGKRIMDQGGTLAYIADIQEENRKALDVNLPTNGERLRAQGEDV
jgi:hypothetical protein